MENKETEKMTIEEYRKEELQRFFRWVNNNVFTFIKICRGTIDDEDEFNQVHKILTDEKFFGLAHVFIMANPYFTLKKDYKVTKKDNKLIFEKRYSFEKIDYDYDVYDDYDV